MRRAIISQLHRAAFAESSKKNLGHDLPRFTSEKR
jgi:hypothetical protein